MSKNVLATHELVDEAIERFDHYGFPYEVKSYDIGHIHVWDLEGNRYQFWAGTGKILGYRIYGIDALIRLLNGEEN